MSASAAPTATAHGWGDLADDAHATRLLEEALAGTDVAGLSFADVRLVEAEELRLYTARSGGLDERSEHTAGIGVRVLVDGAWGFAAVPLSGPGSPGDRAPRLAAEQAVGSARAGSGFARAELPRRAPSSGTLGGAGRASTRSRSATPNATPSCRRWCGPRRLRRRSARSRRA